MNRHTSEYIYQSNYVPYITSPISWLFEAQQLSFALLKGWDP